MSDVLRIGSIEFEMIVGSSGYGDLSLGVVVDVFDGILDRVFELVMLYDVLRFKCYRFDIVVRNEYSRCFNR